MGLSKIRVRYNIRVIFLNSTEVKTLVLCCIKMYINVGQDGTFGYIMQEKGCKWQYSYFKMGRNVVSSKQWNKKYLLIPIVSIRAFIA